MNPIQSINALLSDYFDGLFTCDIKLLSKVFHDSATYNCLNFGNVEQLTMTDYFARVKQRPSPKADGHMRTDKVISITVISDTLATAIVSCSIQDRDFCDVLSLFNVNGQWQIIAKVFHFDKK